MNSTDFQMPIALLYNERVSTFSGKVSEHMKFSNFVFFQTDFLFLELNAYKRIFFFDIF